MASSSKAPTPIPISPSNWSNLPDDLLISILAQLSSLEIMRVTMVCSSWNRIVRDCNLPVPAPWLIMPSKTEEGEDIDGCRFYSVEEDESYFLKKSVYKDFGKRRCIGSSHGWLILLDNKRARPFLFNPFSSNRILLPPPETFPDIVSYSDGDGDGEGEGEGYNVLDPSSNSKRFMSIKELRDDGFFHKAILSSSPRFQFQNNNYGAIIIYNGKSKLAFWKHGEVAWKSFNGARQSGYSDVICTSTDNIVYALSAFVDDNSGWTVEAWDFKQRVPVMLMRVTAPLQQPIERVFWPNTNETNSYAVESWGDILLVVRRVRKEKTVNLTPMQMLYITIRFHVYKLEELDSKLKRYNWVPVDMDSDYWGHRVLFLGGNQSLSLPAKDFPKLRAGSIYYTDDFWDLVYKNPTSGGHDTGIYQGKRVRNFFPCHHPKLQPKVDMKIEPPPFWVLPDPF